MSIPNLSKRIFWDVNFDALDYENDKRFIIDKVMNYGLWDDFVALMHFYGKETVRKEVVQVAFFKKDVLNFLCFYLKLNLKDFKCYNLRQSQEQHWNY